MNRREFIKTLLSLGAAIAMPFDLATASDAEIDAAWERGTFDFEVNEYGTIWIAEFERPITREEAYGYSYGDLNSVSALCKFADSSTLSWPLRNVYEDYRTQLVVDSQSLLPEVSAVAKQKLSVLSDDPDYGWVEWLEIAPEDATEPIYAEVEQYLS